MMLIVQFICHYVGWTWFSPRMPYVGGPELSFAMYTFCFAVSYHKDFRPEILFLTLMGSGLYSLVFWIVDGLVKVFWRELHGSFQSMIARLLLAFRAVPGIGLRPDFVTRFLSWKKHAVAPACVLRRTFRNLIDPGLLQLMLSRKTKNHPHPHAARARSTARDLMVEFCDRSGLSPYMVQPSVSDLQAGLRGGGQIYWMKDALAAPEYTIPLKRDVYCFVDVDFYWGVNCALGFLATIASPVLIYTSMPLHAAGNLNNEEFYTFTSTNELRTEVTGGAFYSHLLWDWNVDRLDVFCPTAAQFTAYNVERFRINDLKILVLLVPDIHFEGIAAWMAHHSKPSGGLHRFCPVEALPDKIQGDECTTSWTCFRQLGPHGTDRPMITFGRPLDYECATIPEKDYVELVNRSGLGTHPFGVSSASAVVPKEIASLTAHFIRCKTPKHIVQTKVDLPPINHYSRDAYYDVAHGFDLKPTLTAFMRPVVAGACYAPTNTPGNVAACISGRVVERQVLARRTVTPTKIRTIALSFFETLARRVGNLGPTTFDAVWDNQPRQTQRNILHLASTLADPFVNEPVSCFLKREAYQEEKDPRAIFTTGPAKKLCLARYLYALAERMKIFPWYGPGKTPEELEAHISLVAGPAKEIYEADIKRFDGSVPQIVWFFYLRFLGMVFPGYNVENIARDTLESEGFFCVGGSCVRFNTGFICQSGNPATSNLGTVVNACIMYCSMVLADVHKRHSLEHHFDALSTKAAAFGDDGLTSGGTVESYHEAARGLGFELDIQKRMRGELFTYLARYYGPSTWDGRPNSCCDIMRQITKMHTTTAINVDAETKALAKALSYAVNDANTPIIGEWCAQVVSLARPEKQHAADVLAHTSFWYQTALIHGRGFTNDPDLFMEDLAAAQLPEFDLTGWRARLASCQTMDELLNMDPGLTVAAPPPIEEAPVEKKKPLIVNGRVDPSDGYKPKRKAAKGKPTARSSLYKELGPTPRVKGGRPKPPKPRGKPAAAGRQ